MLFAFAMVATLEGTATHVLVSTWSARWAWELAASNLYAVLWLAAVYQAARLRPIAVLGDRFVVRSSSLWTVDVPRDRIAAVETAGEIKRAPGLFLRAPVEARGPFGIRRHVERNRVVRLRRRGVATRARVGRTEQHGR